MVGVILALSVGRGAVAAEGLALAMGVGQLQVEGCPVALTLQVALTLGAAGLTCNVYVSSSHYMRYIHCIYMKAPILTTDT